MNIYKTIATGVTIGGCLGLGAYALHGNTPHQPVAADALPLPVVTVSLADIDNMVAAATAADAAIRLSMQACLAKGYNVFDKASGACTHAVGCTACVSKKTRRGYAVIHDNAPLPITRVKVNYSLQLAEWKRHAVDAENDIAARRAGASAYNHVMRCTRIASDADVQCKGV